ncbi:ATP-binding protein [Clostridium paridis]|uniref:histidine kinase n=1 Tax=Clostridium paridis TaxID=2803863 RepID=A0A937K2A3_9CLOT|nr:ATP-binding protein [Clostridium paridis]MBL4931226.1 hypothetical protein [Clostridium paridis]
MIDLEVSKIKKNIGIRIFIPLLMALLVLYIFTNNYSLFHILIEFICTALGLSMALISFARSSNEKSVFKYIGYGFPLMCSLDFLHVMFVNSSISEQNAFISTIFIWVSNNFLDYSLIILSILFIKYKVNNKTIFVSYGFLLIIITLLGILVELGVIMNKDVTQYIINGWLLLYGLLLITIILIAKNREVIGRKEQIYLYLILFFEISYEFVAMLHFKFDLDTLILAHILKYIFYYTLYDAIGRFVFYKTYNGIYKELREVEKIQVVLNRTLQERMKILSEVKSILVRSENKYVSLIESISDGIIIFNEDRVSYSNESIGYYINGYNVNIEGRHLKDILDILEIELTDFSISGYIQYSIKKEILGKVRDLEVYVFKSEAEAKILFIKDVTENNKNFKLKEELEKNLAEEKLKNQFFSNISHELRTPINLIYSSLQVKGLYIVDNNYEALERNSGVIKQNCLRLIRTINNFIDTNRISEEYLVPTYGVYNIVELVENVAQASVRYLRKVKMTLVFDAEEEEIFASCDGELIERAVLNLLSNSIKYGKENGYIYINISNKEDKLYISVKNDGPAISQDIKPYLFDKFTRINKSLNRDKEGSGLGLYLCKSLIELQGGELILNTEKDFGNEFLITLPYDETISESENNSFIIGNVDEKIDIEFSDIYI